MVTHAIMETPDQIEPYIEWLIWKLVTHPIMETPDQTEPYIECFTVRE